MTGLELLRARKKLGPARSWASYAGRNASSIGCRSPVEKPFLGNGDRSILPQSARTSVQVAQLERHQFSIVCNPCHAPRRACAARLSPWKELSQHCAMSCERSQQNEPGLVAAIPYVGQRAVLAGAP
jgi:hypothetical protein